MQVHYMVAADPNSADGIMWGTLRKKLGIVGRTVDGHFNGSAAGEHPRTHLSDVSYNFTEGRE
jgi:hypothetical protein